MIIKIKEKSEFSDEKLWYHILGNDYIAYGSKIANNQELIKITFMPGSVYVGDFDARLESFPLTEKYIKEKYINLDNNLVLLSLNFSLLSDLDLSRILGRIVAYWPVSRLFEHMKSFTREEDITEYKVGYEKLNSDINYISNNIIDYIRKQYPNARADEDLLQDIHQLLWSYLSKLIKEMHTKIIDKCYSLVKSPIIIRLRSLKIKMDGLLGVKAYYEGTMYDKKTKNFVINAAISSFIKALPIELWQLSNEDALSILVTPKVKYKVVYKSEYDDIIDRSPQSTLDKMKVIFVEPKYYLILRINCTLSKSINSIRISLNITTLSFLLKSRLINRFGVNLIKVINMIHESVTKEFLHSRLVCSRLAI